MSQRRGCNAPVDDGHDSFGPTGDSCIVGDDDQRHAALPAKLVEQIEGDSVGLRSCLAASASAIDFEPCQPPSPAASGSASPSPGRS